jgi:protein HIRA/HIR1
VVSSYDPALSAWVKLSERWWSEGSDTWQGRRANTQSTGRGILSAVEGSIGGTPDEAAVDKQRPKWWVTAMTLGHLETRLNATRLLDSPQEYKQAMSMYAKRIADEGFRAKAEELIKELFGPIYWYVSDVAKSLVVLIFCMVADLDEKMYGHPRSLDCPNVTF